MFPTTLCIWVTIEAKLKWECDTKLENQNPSGRAVQGNKLESNLATK